MKCDPSDRANYFDPDTKRCEAPLAVDLEDIFSKGTAGATMDLFASFGLGGFSGIDTAA